MSELIRLDRAGPIATVTINRPEKMNAFTREMYSALKVAFETLIDAPGDVRVVILRGAGEKAFAAGTDISVFLDFHTRDQALEYEKQMSALFETVERCSLPIIAALAGACTGGGAAIAALADIRLASADLRYGFPIARTLGNCLSAASLSRLTDLPGPALVKDMLLTARLIEAPEALTRGLVREVLPSAPVLFERANALATEMATLAPLTQRVTKVLMGRLAKAASKIEDADLIALSYTSEDFREGRDAFLAKRRPQWTGR